MNKVFKVGLIGCGHISETYFRAQEYFNNIRIVKCADINLDAAKKSDITYVISIKTNAYKWMEGSAFWDSPTLEIPTTKENEEALKLYKEGKGKQRQGV